MSYAILTYDTYFTKIGIIIKDIIVKDNITTKRLVNYKNKNIR